MFQKVETVIQGHLWSLCREVKPGMSSWHERNVTRRGESEARRDVNIITE